MALEIYPLKDRRNYELVELAIDYFRDNQHAQPTVHEVAAVLNVSEGHLHRLFRQWTGLTPKQFLQALTVDRAKELLKYPASVLNTALDVGLSGSSRLHDHFVTLEAMTPAEYRDSGAQLAISHGQVDTPFGRAFVAFTHRGVCQFTFIDGSKAEDGELRLKSAFGNASLVHDPLAAQELMAKCWQPDAQNSPPSALRLLVKGTNFQVQVWRALLQVKQGSLVDYSCVAQAIGKPRATRAVATAIGANPVALFIPCHRVIRRDGKLGGYRWGLARKQMVLVKEQRAN